MRNMFHKFLALALVACMICSFGVLSASAAAPAYEDGTYTANVAFLHESKDKASMCNVMFDHDADIVVKGETATISVYAAYPVPAFPAMGTDGTVKDVYMTLDGQRIDAVSDITTKPIREMDESNPSFKLKAGESIPTQIVSFTVPTAKLATLETEPATVTAYVNVVMNSVQTFRLKVTNILPPPTETSAKSMQITAEIVAPEATYTVTIPESIALGTLSKDVDTKVAYEVPVTAENLGTGKVGVSAPAKGQLASGENTLAYANSFGQQFFSANGTLKGEFTVTAADVAAAAAGNYTGTASFAIAYYAGK